MWHSGVRVGTERVPSDRLLIFLLSETRETKLEWPRTGSDDDRACDHHRAMDDGDRLVDRLEDDLLDPD